MSALADKHAKERAARDRTIRRQHASGLWSTAQLAEMHKLTRQRVWQIVSAR